MMNIAIVGDAPARLWSLTGRERITRIARAQGLGLVDAPASATILANAAFAFEPLWLRHVAAHPGMVLTLGGVPVLAHVPHPGRAAAVAAAMAAMAPADVAGLDVLAGEDKPELVNPALRKRIRPFVDRLLPETVRPLQEASYSASYKGVTDLLTKYLWPRWAFHLTRAAAHLGITPNQVTLVGFIACVAATFLFAYGWYWAGIASGMVLMVLDTVDGKLARCTITSSKWGNVFDHGIDLIHPPFWWVAWIWGLTPYGRPLPAETVTWVLAVILGGYVVQRLIEGAFMRLFGGMHIHVWRRIDSQFRLITARRNPNMVILFAAMLFARPDLGIVAVAWWTAISLAVHMIQLIQALIARSQGRAVISWLD
ncbi:CDP-alcohol phosphatidyltransferase family protein [Sphingomonas jatrophae]|uniref:CDP-alcohol phosphatidyltransferase n=1 Tax=Sphingomonas jatrophae TaxID=1166337 RepID=A0A1I6JZR6_9SPHN|nr:CDP-alcohol phosphatidyltransferase family protein [Sphingomonas jatrophae]SFR84368.1 CDP-alcohol phosphatidyltransferase [Sphingomonas jatrophae]